MPTATEDRLVRCVWIGNDPLMLEYHDHEWGVPVHDDRKLFEFIVLSGAQAGLNWRTILRRRDAYREAFADVDPIRIARFDQRKIDSLLHNDRIIRNRRKIEGAVQNARAYVALRQRVPSLDEFMWDFVGGKPIVNHWRTTAQIPASTPESDAMSKAMKKAGFTFFGTTICYAHMQAVGMVNDHLVTCFRYRALTKR
ncbi:MAG: DNA-3-methyladenine glycosylase [Candidatus Eremiobacteraeota bacterium]|nr:DNA-3-methyladenine glycosylase [Candidatus Eremiobacteraeota bacterium]